MRIKGLAAISLALCMALVFGCATTQKSAESAKADWQFHDIVDVAFVQPYATVPQPQGVMIIDARPKRAKYDKGHIPMAVSIPDSHFDKMTAKLPADKNALLIFYCEGLK
jgi:3-mercaptopyruvate sulfurtransferase SseA